MARAKPKRERDQFKVVEMPLCPRKSRQTSPNPPPCPEDKLTKYSPLFYFIYHLLLLLLAWHYPDYFIAIYLDLRVNKHCKSVFVLIHILL